MCSLSHRGDPGKGSAAGGSEDIGAQPHPNRLDTLCLFVSVCVHVLCVCVCACVCVHLRDFTINHILCDFVCFSDVSDCHSCFVLITDVSSLFKVSVFMQQHCDLQLRNMV